VRLVREVTHVSDFNVFFALFAFGPGSLTEMSTGMVAVVAEAVLHVRRVNIVINLMPEERT
jgi:hypothetical protein